MNDFIEFWRDMSWPERRSVIAYVVFCAVLGAAFSSLLTFILLHAK